MDDCVKGLLRQLEIGLRVPTACIQLGLGLCPRLSLHFTQILWFGDSPEGWGHEAGLAVHLM